MTEKMHYCQVWWCTSINSRAQGAKAGGSSWVWDHLGIYSELQDGQDYIKKPCVKT